MDPWLFFEAGEVAVAENSDDNPWLEEDPTKQHIYNPSRILEFCAFLKHNHELPVAPREIVAAVAPLQVAALRPSVRENVLQVLADEVGESTEALSPLQWGAATLAKRYGMKVGRVGESMHNLHRITALRRVRAAAETACVFQESFLRQLLVTVARLCDIGHFRAVSYVEHIMHDETKIEAKARFPNDTHSEKQQVRCFVVEQSVAMLLEFVGAEPQGDNSPRQFISLEAMFSPAIRAGETATGETIAAILQSVNPTPLELLTPFPDFIRIIETDECAANPRAESLVWNERKACYPNMNMALLSSHCLCHKVHAAASKSWTLQAEVVSGLINVGKFLQGPGTMKRFRDSVLLLLGKQLEKTPARKYIEPPGAQ
eukprot:869392-Amphidinium_carterae.4